MKIGDYQSFIEFELMRKGIPNDPSLEFSIKVENGEFKGQVHEVYFWLQDLKDFVNQLETVEKSHQGKAILKEMSHLSEYRSFWMELFSINGSLALNLEIQKIGYMGSEAIIQNKLATSFEIAPSNLTTIIAEFGAYLS